MLTVLVAGLQCDDCHSQFVKFNRGPYESICLEKKTTTKKEISFLTACCILCLKIHKRLKVSHLKQTHLKRYINILGIYIHLKKSNKNK